jgi:methylaspartate mutase epsilon subunit
MNSRTHSVLLGGVGGDCHSVGLTILRHSLLAHAYRVHYLGTQNTVADFFRHAPLFDVVMISSMDGHSRFYLAEYPDLLAGSGSERPLWYLGGNLGIGDDALGFAKYYLEMGFARVFAKFADIETVLALLARDLAERPSRAGPDALCGEPPPQPPAPSRPVTSTRVEDEDLARARRDVLQHWRSGRQAASLEDNAVFLARQPSFPAEHAAVLRRARPMLLQPRSGVATIGDQIRAFRSYVSAGARVLSYQVDSLTRLNEYAQADEAIRESVQTGVSSLNGFPVVSHGVAGLRRVIGAIGVPLQTRHSTRDPRLLAEISYAGGVTAFEGGAICYNIPYYKDYRLADSIPVWQYVDRLTAQYFERFGIALDREFFGTLTGTLIPPCLAIAVDLLESILAVTQGVKCLSLGYAEQGHRVQDIAAIRTLGRMARDLVRALGYRDVQINTVFHQYMAAFPNDRARAESLIYQSAITAGLSGATRALIKTPVEAFRIPSIADNVLAMALVRAGVAAAATEPVDEPAVEAECRLIARETQAILDSVIYSGSGDVAPGIVQAFRRGLLDIPFAPSIHNAGAVLTARDLTGAVRFLSTGHLAFDAELRDLHRYHMDERRRAEGISSSSQSYRLVERDVMRIARGEYAGWPLSQPDARTVVLS